MESAGDSVSTCCFICNETLTEGEVILVKQRGVKTLLSCSVTLKNREHERLLKEVHEISVHRACQKSYTNPKLITATVKRGQNEVKLTKPTRSSTQQFNFRDCCFLCGEEITLQFVDNKKKITPEKK